MLNFQTGHTLKRWRCVSLCSLYVVEGIDSRKLLCKSSNKEIRCHQRFLLTSTVRSRLIVRTLTSRYFGSKWFSQKLRILECMTRLRRRRIREANPSSKWVTRKESTSSFESRSCIQTDDWWYLGMETILFWIWLPVRSSKSGSLYLHVRICT